MRAAILISVVIHVAFVALALVGVPKLFDDAAVRPIEVELVRSEDAPPENPKKPEEPPKPEKDKETAWDPLPNQAPWPESARIQSQPQPNTQQAEAQPQQPSPQPQPDQAQSQQPPPPAKPSIFDPANIPALLNLPVAPDLGFDFESTTAADISAEERAAFRAHLRKCWKLPANITAAQTTRVVLRIYLRRDGTLASDPVLIEASASRDGPAVLLTAIRALKDCQPYGFLPAGKYNEWKVLDLGFSPREMAGG